MTRLILDLDLNDCERKMAIKLKVTMIKTKILESENEKKIEKRPRNLTMKLIMKQQLNISSI
jgi:hypothetical protein